MKAFIHHDKRTKNVAGLDFVAAEVRIGVGAWVVFAKADVRNISSQQVGMELVLDSHGFVRVPDKSFVILPVGASETVSLCFGFETQGLPLVRLLCSVGQDNAMQISNVTISAIPVEGVQVSAVPVPSTPPHGPHDEPSKEPGYE
jgi:hypothetical protein